MGAFTGLTAYFDKPLTDYAVQYGYDKANIVILEGDEASLRRDHPVTYNNLLSCRHNSDRRTFIQYGQDLVASCIFEDYFLDQVKNDKFCIEKAGADRNREILSNTRVTNASDYTIVAPGKDPILLELVNDYTAFWVRTNKLHLRDDKYNKLRNSNSLLLAIALSENNHLFSLIDFRKDIPATLIPYHKPYGKAAYELGIQIKDMYDFSVENIVDKISEAI